MRRLLSQKSRKIRGVLSEVLVIVGVEDGLSLIAEGQILGFTLAVNVVMSSAVDGEVGRLVDKRSGLGIGTDGGGLPEGTAEVDLSKLRGIYREVCW